MAKKEKVTFTAVVVRRPDGTVRGIRVTRSDGSRDFLRADGVPAALRAVRVGKVDPWVYEAVKAWDAYGPPETES